MKKMYLKYKVLINGLNPIGEYEIDGFSIKEAKFEENIFKTKYEKDKDGINFNMNLYLMSCLTDYENLFLHLFLHDANFLLLEYHQK